MLRVGSQNVILLAAHIGRLLFGVLLALLIGTAVLVVVWSPLLHAAHTDRVYASAAEVPLDHAGRVAIVLGAGLTRSGRPSPALADRLATAVELYRRGHVTKLLLTGDNRYVSYNEPEAMRRRALELGVPDEDLVLDYAGRRTYDSCYRARAIFGLDRAVVVTQAFHLDRALYLCDSFGIEAIGVAADRRSYGRDSTSWWSLREAAALVAAWLDVNILKPTPLLGDKIPIDA